MLEQLCYCLLCNRNRRSLVQIVQHFFTQHVFIPTMGEHVCGSCLHQFESVIEFFSHYMNTHVHMFVQCTECSEHFLSVQESMGHECEICVGCGKASVPCDCQIEIARWDREYLRQHWENDEP